MKNLSEVSLIILILIISSCTSVKNIKSSEMMKNDKMNMAKEAIYTASNKADGNSIVGFLINPNGSLTKIGEFKTGRNGTGNIEIFDWGFDETHPLKDGIDPLISAYGVFKTEDNKNILVVNAGDGTISIMQILEDKSLKLVDTRKTADEHPLSIASHKNIVYVAKRRQ